MTKVAKCHVNRTPMFIAGIVFLWISGSAGCGGKDTGGNRSPIFNTGVGASVVEPGGSLPAMPPPGVSNRSAPGRYNQSSRGGAQTQAPTQSASQGGARILSPGGSPSPQSQPGYPGPAYPAPSGGGGGMVSIGGATTVDTRTEKREMKPMEAMARNPLLWPVAAVAWPFQKIASSVKSSADRSHSGGPQSVPPPLSPEEVDQLHDRQQTLAMERALAQRDGGGSNPSTQAPRPRVRPVQQASQQRPPTPRWEPTTPRPTTSTGSTSSIADELAALRWGIGGSGSSQSASRQDPPRARDVPGQPHASSEPGDPRYRQRFDDNGDGRPDREEVYDAEGLIAESAEDASGDGNLDTWTRYRNGAPMRRRADGNGDGLIDAWTYYDNGGLDVVRLERDTDGDGYRDQIDFFTDGILARRTEDPNGDGFPERVTRFAPDGRPAERDEDSDGDGAMDTRSFYESGRLVRRILLNEDERWEP